MRRCLVLCAAALALQSVGCSKDDSTSGNWIKNKPGSDAGDGSVADVSSDVGPDGAGKDAAGEAGQGSEAGDGGGPVGCTPGLQKTCYEGPAGTADVGQCKSGKSTCAQDGLSFGPCVGQVLPADDNCLDKLDNDCNGVVDDGNHTAAGCACQPDAVKCVNGKASVCDDNGDWGPPAGMCCEPGTFTCDCNQVMQCDLGPPPKWVPTSPATICSPTSQRCDATTGTCKSVATTGTNVATGNYYQYAIFQTSGGVFKGGYDVDAEGDYIYVNRNAAALDVYKVTLLDTDGDGKLEPNQHPSNPTETGPMEQRVLTFVATYTTAEKAPMGSASAAELLAGTDRIFSLGPTRNGDITEYLFATKTTNVVVHPKTTMELSHLGYAAAEGKWYGSNENARRVYSYCPSSESWLIEFNYPDMAGSHMDGLEAIVSFSTGVQYIYVSDMTSDFIGQYRRDSKGGWVQENLFKYDDSTSSVVEGMGFGALHHFWATGGDILYEIGGGDLTGYLQ